MSLEVGIMFLVSLVASAYVLWPVFTETRICEDKASENSPEVLAELEAELKSGRIDEPTFLALKSEAGFE